MFLLSIKIKREKKQDYQKTYYYFLKVEYYITKNEIYERKMLPNLLLITIIIMYLKKTIILVGPCKITSFLGSP